MKYKGFIINSCNSFYKYGQHAAVVTDTMTGQFFWYDNFCTAVESVREMARQMQPERGRYNVSFNAGSSHGVYYIEINKPSLRACLDLVSGWLVSGYNIEHLTIRTTNN